MQFAIKLKFAFPLKGLFFYIKFFNYFNVFDIKISIKA